jgi:8-oxo-dGTP diphosphatase
MKWLRECFAEYARHPLPTFIGVLELTETIHDGLRREVREETGLDIEPGALTGVYKNMPRGIIALVFRCKITGGQLVTAIHL